MGKLDELKLKGKKVLIRLDLNVSSRDPDEIAEEDRLTASLPMIRYAQKRGAKVILMSHLGRPDGKVVPEESLAPVAEALEKKLDQKVTMAPDCIGSEVENIITDMQDGDITLLENLRFNPGEESNDPAFVKALARLGEIYINDAFGTAHREHASVYGLPLLFKQDQKAAGLLMQKEIDMWSSVMENQGPKYLCLGGKKLSEKIGKALKKLSKEFDKVYVGGPVYNVIRAAQDRNIGSSLVTEKNDDTDYIAMARELLPKVKNIVMPDYIVIARKEGDKFVDEKRIKESEDIPPGYAIVDCIYEGEKLEQLKKANVAVGFGPFGVFEKEKGGFAEGTNNLANALNSVNIVVLGGGESAKAYKGTKAQFSTGGGASITYLSKKELPAVNALN